MILAEKIALLRRQNGWSQEELANQLNVSRQAVSKWEGGMSIPDLDKILKLSALFEVSTDYLLKDGCSHAKTACTQHNRMGTGGFVSTICYFSRLLSAK